MATQATWRLNDPELSKETRLVFMHFNYIDPELGFPIEETKMIDVVCDVFDISEEEALRMVGDGVWSAIISTSARERLPIVAKELAAKSLREPKQHESVEYAIKKALDEGREDYAEIYLRRLTHFACRTFVGGSDIIEGNQEAALVEA